MSLPAPNQIHPGETLKQFHERILGHYDTADVDAAVTYLRPFLEPEAAQIRTLIAANPEGWMAPFHFFSGMAIRNLLRNGGFGEEFWPIWNLDDIYVPLIEKAVEETK